MAIKTGKSGIPMVRSARQTSTLTAAWRRFGALQGKQLEGNRVFRSLAEFPLGILRLIGHGSAIARKDLQAFGDEPVQPIAPSHATSLRALAPLAQCIARRGVVVIATGTIALQHLHVLPLQLVVRIFSMLRRILSQLTALRLIMICKMRAQIITTW